MALVIEKHRSFRNRPGKCQCYFPSQKHSPVENLGRWWFPTEGLEYVWFYLETWAIKKKSEKLKKEVCLMEREAWAQGRWAVSRSKCISTSPLKCVAAKATSHWGIGGSGFWIFPCCGLCCLWWVVLTISGSQRWLLSDSICISGTW